MRVGAVAGVLKMPDVNRNGRGSESERDLFSVTQAAFLLCQHEDGERYLDFFFFGSLEHKGCGSSGSVHWCASEHMDRIPA